jgi:uncharacterized BrkB/YihY/UPF0761 family membrane protein
MEYIVKVQTFFHHTKELWAVMIGMFIQYWFGEKKSHRIIITIILSTLVVALYFVPMIIEILNMVLGKMFQLKIELDSKIAIALYAFSTIISVDILSMIINILPEGMKKQAKKYLGVDDANNRP